MQKRNLNLDVARIVAVLAVVMIHVSGKFIMGKNASSYEFFFGNIFDCVARIGVPIFVMISGALLLDENKNVSIASIFSKKIVNIVNLIIFWSVFYCIIDQIIIPIREGRNFDLPTFMFSLLDPFYHMWYLYMIIGVYIATPFLRIFVKKANQKLVCFFITISLLTQFTLPLLNGMIEIRHEISYIVDFVESFHLEFFNGYITYYLVGWYVVNVGIKKRNKLYILGMLSVFLNLVFVFVTKDYINAYSNMNILVFLYSLSVFIAINQISFDGVSGEICERIKLFSNLSFGIYIIHPALKLVMEEIFLYNGNIISYIIFFFIVLVAVSFIICLFISKIPYLKKIIRM